MPRLSRILIIIGSLSLTVALLLGALGFHALDAILTPEKKLSWAWAVELQAYNSLGLVLVGILATRLTTTTWLAWAGGLMTLGLFLFSGSIYVESLGAPPVIGQVAPFGGWSFMAGWVLVALAVFRNGDARAD